jgi:hypothetical protein
MDARIKSAHDASDHVFLSTWWLATMPAFLYPAKTGVNALSL